jgi:hypothetical protein
MPLIENHAEHAFHLPPQSRAIVGKDADGKDVKDGALMATPVVFQDAVTFERAGRVDDDGNPVPSRTRISAATLKHLQEHPIAKGWFKPAGGKLQLRIADSDEVPEGAVVNDQTKKPTLAAAGGNQGVEITKPEKQKG